MTLSSHFLTVLLLASVVAFPASLPGQESFVLIPAGPFQMGDQSELPHDGFPNELPVHTVNVGAFHIGTTEVTKAQWDANHSYAVSHGYVFSYPGSGKAANHPVQQITWFDALKWCNARSEQEGREPCYYQVSDSAVFRSLFDESVFGAVVRCDFNKDGFRLPTEAEWEKASRGSRTGERFPWGQTITHGLANYEATPNNAFFNYDKTPTPGPHPAFATGSQPYTAPVGSFTANGYGLFDMAGNVAEWCWGWNGNYPNGMVNDPNPVVNSLGTNAVTRGGGWSTVPSSVRQSNRQGELRSSRRDSIGFRIVRAVITPPGFGPWQSLHFTLPAEAALAAPDADPDKDGLVNLVEYALRTRPRSPDPALPGPFLDNTGTLQLALDVRDDDPKLSAVGQSGASPVSLDGSLAPLSFDFLAGDGLKTLLFTDQPPPGANAARFLRVRFTLNP